MNFMKLISNNKKNYSKKKGLYEKLLSISED